MYYLVIIPARGGSKGIPKKNSKLLNNKPLIQYSIEVAKALPIEKTICVSTDDEAIKNIVEDLGTKVPFLRPEHLATDQASSQDVLLHAIAHYENLGVQFDAVVLLQPTSPFRTVKQVENAISLFNKNLDMVVSVKESEANPYYNIFEENSTGFLEISKKGSFTRRQDTPKVWEYNGAIYVINIESLKTKKMSEFKHIKKYEMDALTSTDIDNPIDWKWCEFILNEGLLDN
ncbi:acylneuraminate cytidylyltransferase family protein [Lacinutrix salivirga]